MITIVILCLYFEWYFSRLTAGLHKGKPYYMAPEMIPIRGGRVYDKKVDIWAVGVILYEMGSKKLPVRPCQ